MTRGKFITFEGGEGCGKSTQVRRLAAELERRGIRAVFTREPGGTELGERIRRLLKDPTDDPPRDRAEVMLFLAARAQLVEEVIRPALERGDWVVSDRFSDSTFAYQGYGRGLDVAELRALNAFACAGLTPDKTFLLDVDPAEATCRMRAREAASGSSADRIERAGEAFHARLRRGFLEMAAAEPERIVRIDANGDEDSVFAQILDALEDATFASTEN